jgi:hypothetical protein
MTTAIEMVTRTSPAVQIHYTQEKRANGGCWGTRVRDEAATVRAARAYAADHDLVPAGHVHHAWHAAMGAETLLTYGSEDHHGRGTVYGRLYAPRAAVRLATAPLPAADRRRLLALWRQGGLASALLATCSDDALRALAAEVVS